MSSRGYYSLIQYMPDPSRLEAMNIGVLLFSPDQGYLEVQMLTDTRRISRFFGSEIDRDWIKSQQAAFANRVRLEGKSFGGLEDLQGFMATRANEIRLTTPRPMKVTRAAQELNQLFDKLVAEPSNSLVAEQDASAGISPKEELEKAIKCLPKLPNLLTNLKVRLDRLDDRSLDIPYAYKNGRWNLLLPVSLPKSEPMTAIYRLAVEGRYLHEHNDPEMGARKLVLISRFPDQDRAEKQIAAKRVLEESKVEYFDIDEIPTLTGRISKH